MSRPQKSSFAAWLRGGQTLAHTYDMVLEVLGRLAIVAALWGVLCFFSINRFAGAATAGKAVLPPLLPTDDGGNPPQRPSSGPKRTRRRQLEGSCPKQGSLFDLAPLAGDEQAQSPPARDAGLGMDLRVPEG